MKRIRQKKLLVFLRGKSKFFATGLGIFLALFLVLLAGYARSYDQKVLLNTYLFGQAIAGKNRPAISEILVARENDSRGKSIHLKYEDRDFDNTLENLGWDLDEEATTQKIFDYGHSQNGFANIASSFRSIFLKKRFKIVYSVNERLVEDWLSSINTEVAKTKTEANVIVRDGQAKVINPEGGTKINQPQIKADLDRAFLLESENDIYLNLVDDVPIISAEQAASLANEAMEKSQDTIALRGPGGSISLYPNTLGAMIELKAEMTEGGYFKEPELKRVYVSLNNAKVRSHLESNANYLNIEPVDARFTISGGSVALLRPSVDGEAIKINESTDQIVATFEGGQEKEIALPYETQEPAIRAQSAGDIEQFGIKELIGRATTDFSNSPDNRVHNISNGVKYISGALVKPGDEFSTIKKLGKIDQDSGYLPELVIKEDETVPEFGGGLCQVSTTLFRAAMNAGLNITERQNHSYRVSYYEPPVGMDATIYSPKPDLRFLNNTDNAILIYGYVSGRTITFEIYGTDDGREVEITTPEIFDITSPPETIYIEDPSLQPGEEKRLDRAHDGAKAAFYYRVRKDGKLIDEERFFSYYVAWPAKYARGPQQEGGENGEGEGEPN